jgi:hypothetical protein
MSKKHQAFYVFAGLILLCAHQVFAGQPCQQQFPPMGTSQNSSDLNGAVTWLNGNISQDLNWCPVQKKIGLTANQAITLLGYELKGGGSREIRYEIDDFTNSNAPTGKNCTMQISVIQIPNSLDAITKTVVNDPICGVAKPI